MPYNLSPDGSPLIPPRFIIVYLLIFLGIFFYIFLLIKGKNGTKKKKSLKKIVSAFIGAKLFLLVLISLSAFFYLFPKPQIVQTIPADNSFGIDINRKIEISFDRPVNRKEMVKNLYPYTPGIFIFEDPVYDTHLYRKLSFYPKFQLKNDTSYTLSLTNVRSFLTQSQGDDFRINFRTKAINVLGIQNRFVEDGNLHITGTFPEIGWTQVAADVPIKITFNKPVNKDSIISNFSITPALEGVTRLENNTFIFTPDRDLPFNTIFTVKIHPGVVGIDGSVLNEEYELYFASQEKIFRLAVPANYQKYALSCEIASLRMALLYRGLDLSEDQLLSDIGLDPAARAGSNWGNPYVGFVGNVRGRQMVNGYGVFWEPVARAANKYRHAQSFENWTIDRLTDSLQKGTPVIVWIALKGGKPVEWTAPSGDKIKTIADEHAVLAVGFAGVRKNPSQIIINDPLAGETYWETDIFEKKWSVFNKSGVAVY